MTHLRIVHLIDLERWGGVEKIYLDLIQSIAPAGLSIEHHTHLERLRRIVPHIKTALYRHSHSVTTSHKLGVFPLPRHPHALRARNSRRLIRSIKPDLILVWNHIHHTLCHLDSPFSCPVIYYEHGMVWDAPFSQKKHRLLPQINAVITASYAAKRMLELKHQILTLPITVCPNPLGLNRPTIFTPRHLPPPRQRLRLGCAARLAPQKAVALLILTVHALRERGMIVEAFIAGEGPQRAQIEALIQRLNLTQSVRLLGLVNDMADFYRDIDLFVCPSVYEPLGLVCLEAMAQGIPVICTSTDGLTETVIDQVTGYCLTPTLSPEEYTRLTGIPADAPDVVYDPTRDQLKPSRFLAPEAIANAINDLIAHPTRYTEMSQACIKHMQTQFDYQTYLKNFYGLLVDMTQQTTHKNTSASL